jgi:hypothetical protein
VSKSGKQRRDEIRRKRLDRAKRLQARLERTPAAGIPPGAGVEPADRAVLARHNNTYGALPAFYVDKVFECRDCGAEEVWTAKQQKWWYEVAHGPIDSIAVRCLPCRRRRRNAGAQPGANLLRELCAQARALGEGVPDAAAWREMDAALASKWWGVRTVAIGSLGRWGDGEAIARLKALIEAGETSKRWGSWASEGRRAAIEALGARLPPSEVDWARDYCLTHSDWGLSPLHGALGRQPLPWWEAVIAVEWRHDDPERLARLVWMLGSVEAAPDLLRRWHGRFAGHPDPRVGKAAGWAFMPRMLAASGASRAG